MSRIVGIIPDKNILRIKFLEDIERLQNELLDEALPKPIKMEPYEILPDTSGVATIHIAANFLYPPDKQAQHEAVDKYPDESLVIMPASVLGSSLMQHHMLHIARREITRRELARTQTNTDPAMFEKYFERLQLVCNRYGYSHPGIDGGYKNMAGLYDHMEVLKVIGIDLAEDVYFKSLEKK